MSRLNLAVRSLLGISARTLVTQPSSGAIAMHTTKYVSLAAVLLGLGSLPVVAHATGCSNAAIKGTYGNQATVTQSNNVPPLFGEVVGTMRFDGVGNGVSNHLYASSDGAVGGGPVTFIYTVAPDCTLTIAWSNGETFVGVIVLDGQEIDYIETSGTCCGSAIIRRGRATRLHIN